MSKHSHKFDDLELFKNQLYQWVEKWPVFQICDSNQSPDALQLGQYELLLGCAKEFNESQDFSILNDSISSNKWLMLSINYPELNQNAHFNFFEPEILIVIKKKAQTAEFIINGTSNLNFKELLNDIISFKQVHESEINQQSIQFQALTDRSSYLRQVNAIRKDIQYGKYYELNYCIEFQSFNEFEYLHPHALRLNRINKAPFAVFSKFKNEFLICSSPERFIIKNGNQLYSQPIKGTNKRLAPEFNEQQKENLKNNLKERAENVMIVDLVRNDLAKVSKSGTIQVEELFGVYEFQSVNHLISTISSELKDSVTFSQIMNALFPMGSMTGAPKLEVMMHINQYETGHRGVYSGCSGYIDDDGNFDFNVIIRSLFYNDLTKKLSFKVGSAITYDSDADQEYEECILKGKKLEELFQN
jgi:para-aminobenzoate synthetase component I